MEILFLPKTNLPAFLEALHAHGRLVVPAASGAGQYRYVEYADLPGPEEVALEFLRTALPLKKYFFPAEEVLSTYSEQDGYQEAPLDEEPPILFGPHPCELHGLRVTDKFFTDGYGDYHYERRREGARIIGLGCMPDDKCFCPSTGTDHIEDVYDLFLWEIEAGFVTMVRTPAGHSLVHLDRALFSHIQRDQIVEHQKKLEVRRNSFNRVLPISDLPQLLRFEEDSPAWKELGDSCFACGACSMVCPTCTCFTVFDRTDLSGEQGERVRRWDSCLFRDFTRIAGDELMRPDRAARVSNRYYHKEQGFVEQFGMPSCTGCGRCVDACTAGIDITQVFAKVRGSCER